MLDLLLLGFIVFSLEFGGAMHGWRVLCLNGISLEFKIDGEGVPNGNRFAVLKAGLEAGHGLDHADCLGIKFRIYRAGNLDFSYLPILLNYKLQDHTALDTVLGRISGVLDVLSQIVHHRCYATGKLGHLLDRIIDLLGLVAIGLRCAHPCCC